MAKKKPVRRKRPLRSSKTRKTIEAKPTKYRGVEYRSRLEARWAVFLDYYHIMAEFWYEPKTFRLADKGWDFTPDFYFQWSNFPGYLEVKPDIPSPEYLEVLETFANVLPLQLFLVFGDFYRGNVPKIWSPAYTTFKATPEVVKREALKLPIQWPDCQAAIKTVSEYRFDLDGQDPLPPFRSPSGVGPLEHMEQHGKDQQKANRGDRFELMEARRKAMKEAIRKDHPGKKRKR